MDDDKEKDDPQVWADDNSIAIGGINIEGDVSGGITIGHGYTAEQVSLLLKQITTTHQPKPFDGRCPYKGLDVFEEEDAELFFGRERLVKELVGRVKESRTVFITGPSGSGKSSLVRAGLIHALKKGAIKSSERWLYETMKPGREPLKDLALAFSRLKSPELSNYFLAHKNEIYILNECAESVLSGQKNQRFLLFVDQFEEVFTQVSQEDERFAFINMLAHAGTIENGRVIVLFAMRSDFVSNCAMYPALNEMLSQEFRQIGAMQPEELVSAIALPARHVGLLIEDELIARIINDMKGEPGALPLMQFALKDLFDSQQAKGGVIALTLADYLKHGGIHKSLERHADNSFAKLSEDEQQLARSIFSGLIEIGRGTQDTRRTALFDELIPASTKAEDVGAIVQKLADARLIITDEQAGKDTVTISHEKLIDAWPWLRKLVNENRDVIALQNEIASDGKEWEDHKRDASYLYTGARLANAREQLQARKLVLSGLAQSFIDAGVKAHADELQAVKQRAIQLRRRSVYLSVALVIALVAVGVAVFFSIQSRQQAKIALARQLAAQAQSLNLDNGTNAIQSGLLAVEAARRGADWGANQALRRYLAISGLPIANMTSDDSINSVVFSPDGRLVVSANLDGTIRVWETTTGTEVWRMTMDREVHFVTFSSDAKFIVAKNLFTGTCAWEIGTGREVACIALNDDNLFNGFSLDNKYVVFESNDGIIHIWETTTGKEVSHFIIDGSLSAATFSPNNRWIVFTGCDSYDSSKVCIQSTIYVWEISTGQEIAHRSYNGSVSATISPDGRWVVSDVCSNYEAPYCIQGTVYVWEVATGIDVARMTHDYETSGVEISSDSKYISSLGNGNTMHVWELFTGKEVINIGVEGGQIRFGAFSPDGNYLLWLNQNENQVNIIGSIHILNLITGKEVSSMSHYGRITDFAFSQDSKYVVSGSEDGTARVWAVSSGKEIARTTYDDGISSVAFSLDGKQVVSGSFDGTIRVWETITGNEVARVTENVALSDVAISADGRRLIFDECENYDSSGYCVQTTIRVWEVATNKETVRVTYDFSITEFTISSDGRWLIFEECGNRDSFGICLQNTVYILELATGNEIARVNYDLSMSTVTISPNGRWIVINECINRNSSGECVQSTVYVRAAATGKEIAIIHSNHEIYDVAIRPDGKYVVYTDSEGTAHVWEVDSGKEILHKTDAASVDLSPNGNYVVSESREALRIWDAMTGKDVISTDFPFQGNIENLIDFSPSGKYVAVGGNDGNTRLWDLPTGKEVAHMTHDKSVISVAFSTDSESVVSASLDNTARVWESTTGKEVSRLAIVTGNSSNNRVSFSSDGKYLVSFNGHDGSIHLWYWRIEDLIAEACKRLPRNLTRDEWTQYIGSESYQATCTNLPVEPELTLTPSSTP